MTDAKRTKARRRDADGAEIQMGESCKLRMTLPGRAIRRRFGSNQSWLGYSHLKLNARIHPKRNEADRLAIRLTSKISNYPLIPVSGSVSISQPDSRELSDATYDAPQRCDVAPLFAQLCRFRKLSLATASRFLSHLLSPTRYADPLSMSAIWRDCCD